MNPTSSPDANIGQNRDSFTIIREAGGGPVTWWASEAMAREVVARNVLPNPVYATRNLPFSVMRRQCEHIVIAERTYARAIYDFVAQAEEARGLVIWVAWPVEEGQTLKDLVNAGMFWSGLGIAQVVFSADEGTALKITEAPASDYTNTPAEQVHGHGRCESDAPRTTVSDEIIADRAPKHTALISDELTIASVIESIEPDAHPFRMQRTDSDAEAPESCGAGTEQSEGHGQERSASADQSAGSQPEPHPHQRSKTAEIDALIEAMASAVAKSDRPVSDVLAEFRSTSIDGSASGPDTSTEASSASVAPEVDPKPCTRPDGQRSATDPDIVRPVADYGEGHRDPARGPDEIEGSVEQGQADECADQMDIGPNQADLDNAEPAPRAPNGSTDPNKAAAEDVTQIGEQSRQKETSSLAARAAGAVPDDDAVLNSANDGSDRPKHDASEYQRNVDPLSHYRCGEEFARYMEPRIRFTELWGEWQEWIENEGWQRNATSSVHHQCGEFVRNMSVNATARVQTQVQSTGFTRDVVKRTGWRPEVCVKDSELWDADAMVLGLPEGLVCDLKSGGIRRADPDEMITMRAGGVPTETTDCPEFLAALNQWTMGDTAYVEHIQRALGYGLTGLTTEERLIFIHGGGSNGKSVLADIIGAVMGDYADVAPEGMFTAAKFRGHPTSIASTQGKRLIVASETNSNDVWDEARIKQLTGGDRIKAHFMRQDPFTFKPKFLLMFLANNLPTFKDGVDDAIRRRFLIWPFRFKASPSNRDNKLKHRIIQNELPGILRWLVDGCRLWLHDGGLKVPPVVEVETQEYLAEQDLFRQFLEDECEIVQGGVAPSTPLYRQWARYTEDRGEEAGTEKAFWQKLKGAGFKKFQGRIEGKKLRGWLGLRLGRSRGNRGDQ